MLQHKVTHITSDYNSLARTTHIYGPAHPLGNQKVQSYHLALVHKAKTQKYLVKSMSNYERW